MLLEFLSASLSGVQEVMTDYMYMKYCKPSLNITQQIELIESRGMVINDRLRAERHLSNISYYRLSAYMIPYKERDDFGNRKDEFKVGDKCVYIEIDSVLPPKPQYDFMKDRKYVVRIAKFK